MPAPSNDNWASATVITGASGSIAGTNVSATVQASEPQIYNFNPGPVYPYPRVQIPSANTVWYSWTAPADGYVFFSTRDLTGAMLTDFESTVQVFVGASLAGLVAVSLSMDQSVGDGNGADNGASVAFLAGSGGVYYIQVGSRNSGGGGTGLFTLRWGAYATPHLDTCDHCNPLVSNLCKVADFEIDVLSGPTDYTFTIPFDGLYYIIYCGGVWRIQTGPDRWMIIGNNATNGITAVYTVGGVPTTLSFPFDGATGYPTKAAALQQSQTNLCNIWTGMCMSTSGTLKLHFEDDFNYADNQNGSPSPVFGLYYFDLIRNIFLGFDGGFGGLQSFLTVYANGTDHSDGFTYTLYIDALNLNPAFAAGGFTVQMLSGAGNTPLYSFHNPGSGIVSDYPSTTCSYNLGAGARDSNKGWVFTSTQTDTLSIMLRVFDCNGTAVGDVTVLVATGAFAASVPFGTIFGSYGGAGGFCSNTYSSLAPSFGTITITNVGLIPLSNPVLTMAGQTAGDVIFAAPSNGTPCSGPFATDPFVKALGYIEPNIGSNTHAVGVLFALERTNVSAGTPVSGAGVPQWANIVTANAISGSVDMPQYNFTANLQ